MTEGSVWVRRVDMARRILQDGIRSQRSETEAAYSS